jgi:hypothetical protein
MPIKKLDFPRTVRDSRQRSPRHQHTSSHIDAAPNHPAERARRMPDLAEVPGGPQRVRA